MPPVGLQGWMGWVQSLRIILCCTAEPPWQLGPGTGAQGGTKGQGGPALLGRAQGQGQGPHPAPGVWPGLRASPEINVPNG